MKRFLIALLLVSFLVACSESKTPLGPLPDVIVELPSEKTPEDEMPKDKVPEDKVPEDKVPEDKVPEDKTPALNPYDLIKGLYAGTFEIVDPTTDSVISGPFELEIDNNGNIVGEVSTNGPSMFQEQGTLTGKIIITQGTTAEFFIDVELLKAGKYSGTGTAIGNLINRSFESTVTWKNEAGQPIGEYTFTMQKL